MSIRHGYQELGVNNFYEKNAMSYSNPHEKRISNILSSFLLDHFHDKSIKILDLCSGSGEITRIALNNDFKHVIGSDPFTSELYIKNTSKECLTLSFKEIAIGMLNYKFDLIICSFALHLAESSMLPSILYQLSLITNKLIVITPHKKPIIKDFFSLKEEVYKDKVRLRYYVKI